MIEQFVKMATVDQLLEIMANTCMTDMYKYLIASYEYNLRMIGTHGGQQS